MESPGLQGLTVLSATSTATSGPSTSRHRPWQRRCCGTIALGLVSADSTEASTDASAKKSTSTSSSTTRAPKSAAPAGPDFTVTVGELIEEFEDTYLLDITDGGDFEILSVTCHDMDNDVLSELTVGDDITVIGNFEDGGDLGVDLEKCRVV